MFMGRDPLRLTQRCFIDKLKLIVSLQLTTDSVQHLPFSPTHSPLNLLSAAAVGGTSPACTAIARGLLPTLTQFNTFRLSFFPNLPPYTLLTLCDRHCLATGTTSDRTKTVESRCCNTPKTPTIRLFFIVQSGAKLNTACNRYFPALVRRFQPNQVTIQGWTRFDETSSSTEANEIVPSSSVSRSQNPGIPQQCH